MSPVFSIETPDKGDLSDPHTELQTTGSKNTLLPTGHKGCYVLYMDKEGDVEFELVEDEKQTVVGTAGGGFAGADFVPVMISNLGDDATRSFHSFFVDHIRNRNTREAYLRAANRFFDWCDLRGLQFSDVQSFHVSGYIEELGQSLAIEQKGVLAHLGLNTSVSWVPFDSCVFGCNCLYEQRLTRRCIYYFRTDGWLQCVEAEKRIVNIFVY